VSIFEIHVVYFILLKYKKIQLSILNQAKTYLDTNQENST